MESGRYKLIIIDDEYVVIKGLRETIDWSALNVEIAAECKNGAEGLEAIHRLKPDIVISDIRMPKLDGLQLAKRLCSEGFDGAVIIYSGYSDFEYARQAIDYGVTKYILKPIENEALIACVREAIAALMAERTKRTALEQYAMGLPLLRESLIEQVLDGRNTDDALEKLALIGVSLPQNGTVIECCVLQNGTGGDDGLYEELLQSMDDFGATGQKYKSRFVIITGLTRVSVIYNRINELLERNASGGKCRVSVGISNAYGKSQTLQEAYAQAKRLSRSYLFTSINNIRTEDEAVEDKRHKKVVWDALRIISADYGKKLVIKEIADQLYVSESHLMHEFKESLGKTFIECLTECRIQKAKELLREGGHRINEIAKMVGYSDARYLRQVFKEVTGLSPAQYTGKNRSDD